MPGTYLDMLATAIDLAGQDGFMEAVARLCQSVSGYDSTFVVAYFDQHAPVSLFENLDQKFSERTVGPYLDFAYLLDPFYNLIEKGEHAGVITLADCAPDDFLSSEYYQTFYIETGLFDETCLTVPFDRNVTLVISLGSRDVGFSLDDQKRRLLNDLHPCIAALCRRHWPILTPDRVEGHGRMGMHLEKSFSLFSKSVLSEREAEIVQLILKGHSSKSIARVLGNSPETVKVHRKRIHNKLGISSQSELFSLFLDALSRTPANATQDPLTYLRHRVQSTAN